MHWCSIALIVEMHRVLAQSVRSRSSIARHKFSELCESALNRHIQLEWQAHYNYLALAFYFKRDTVGLTNFYEFFRLQAEDETQHAQSLMRYCVDRGGILSFPAINTPEHLEFESGIQALGVALNMEKIVLDSLHVVHDIAQEANDHHLADYLESPFMAEQISAIKELSDLSTVLADLGENRRKADVWFDSWILPKKIENITK